ncbi:MAG: hypothetical protein ACLP7P_20285 [Rhodomicrobium sp.]
MSNPLSALATMPQWMRDIHNYDGLEIAPCAVIGFADGNELVEVCEPADAHFWTVYGHYREGGVLAFEDFPDPAAARAFARCLLNAFPNLQHYGLLDMAGGAP